MEQSEPTEARARLIGAALLGILLAAYGVTLAPGLSWANFGADGGDFIAAVATKGVPHPTGYPTYMLLGRLFLLLPFGEPALRLNLLSAITMSGAGALLGALAYRRMPGQQGRRILNGLAVGLFFGLAPLPWSQAVIAEVHGLNALLILLTIALLSHMADWRTSGLGNSLTLGLLSGIALGNHLTFLLLLPAIGFAILAIARREGNLRVPLLWIAGLLAGLAVYLYLPLAARGHPPVNWGQASTWEGFWWVLSAQPYRGLAFGLPLDEVPQRIAAWSDLLLHQFGLVGLALGVVGLVFGRSQATWIERLTYWMVPVYSLFALGYGTADSIAYLIPVYAGFAWWIGLGIVTLSNRLRGRWKSVVPLLAFIPLAIRAPFIMSESDARADRAAVDFYTQVREEAPRDSLVLTSGTEDSFALWYMHFALHQRQDLRIVVAPLTQFAWYRDSLAHTYPDLSLPEWGSEGVQRYVADLAATSGRTVCRTRATPGDVRLSTSFSCESG